MSALQSFSHQKRSRGLRDKKGGCWGREREGRLTAARLGQLRQPQQRVVARDVLERDVRVPPFLCALLLAVDAVEPVLVKLLGLLGADDADLVVLAAEPAARVADRVDMQLRGCGLA